MTGAQQHEGGADVAAELRTRIEREGSVRFDGQNLLALPPHGIASVGNTHLAHSETSAVVKAESFGLTQWTQLDNAPFNWSTNTEYAIELYGKEVPEPSSLILLLSAPLLYALRRR